MRDTLIRFRGWSAAAVAAVVVTIVLACSADEGPTTSQGDAGDRLAAPVGQAPAQVLQLLELTVDGEFTGYFLLPPFSRQVPVDVAFERGRRFESLEEALRAIPEGIRVVTGRSFVDDESRLLPFTPEQLELAARVRQDIAWTQRSDDWGSGSSSKGNCYRYACGDKKKDGEPHSPFPGGTDPGGHIDCDDVIDGAKCDGATEPNEDGSCPEGKRKICAYIDSSPGWNDYHWYREDSPGSWSHKPGSGAVSTTDASGDPITDPETADRGIYDESCGCLCVPDGGLDVDDACEDDVTPVRGVLHF